MVGGKKVVGICMTKLHDSQRSRMITCFQEEAKKKGMKLMIFNAPFDFFYGTNMEIGLGEIYEYINYNVVDGLVVLSSEFPCREHYERLIEKARFLKMPVVMEDLEYDGCFTVKNAYEDAYIGMLNHVIRDHGAKNPFFMAGYRTNVQSKARIECFKKVLMENNIPFTEDMVDYGNFWEEPTVQAMERLYARGGEMPDAIFCANDVMAVTVCKSLKEHGYRVPEDVKVTGFDGSRIAEFSEPSLTTCVYDYAGFAAKTMAVLEKAFAGETPQKITVNEYHVRYYASCGCPGISEMDLRAMAENYYRLSRNLLGHEHAILNKLIFLLNTQEYSFDSFYGIMARLVGTSSLLMLRPSFLASLMFEDIENRPDEKLICISNADLNVPSRDHFREMDMQDLIPDSEDWAKDDSIYVFNAVQVGMRNCGYYASRLTDIQGEVPGVNRVVNMINIVMHMATVDMKQRYRKNIRADLVHLDPITDIPNLQGVSLWYKGLIAKKSNSRFHLFVSVYEIANYSYIFDNFGIQEVSSLLCYVAEALRFANTKDCFIARISDDRFIVINYYDKDADSKEIGEQLNSCISMFYTFIGRYNEGSIHGYDVDVNAGCVHDTVNSGNKLETLISQAVVELNNNKGRY